jgi:hypothetical protein
VNPAPGKPTLKAIQVALIDRGGYTISMSGQIPPGAKTYLCIEDADNRLDITAKYGQAQMAALLECIDEVDGWDRTLRCWAVMEQTGKRLGETPAQDLKAPVKPLDAPITLDRIVTANPRLTYPGNGFGRTLTKTAIGGKFYFRNGSLLETDSTKRGFDCTTFPMSLFSTYPNMAQKYGTALADALGASKCDMEQKKEADLKAFFADKTKGATGSYFMWSAGHVVLVKDGRIHEFTYGGYQANDFQTWGGYKKAPQGLWWVRKLPMSI